MKKFALLALIVACSHAEKKSVTVEAPKPEPTPRNFVCERVAELNKEAKCTPEYTDSGEHHAHTARVIIGENKFSCVINDSSLSVVCGDLLVMAQRSESEKPAEPTKTKTKK